MMHFENDIEHCIEVMNTGGLILYPTDTIWGIGCDATNDEAVEKIFTLKKRHDRRSMIVLVATVDDLRHYTEDPGEKIFEFLSAREKPTTVIYERGKNISPNLVNNDGSIAIRVVMEPFCSELIKRFKKPVVSTSANISGEAFPNKYKEINSEIKNGVDYIVQHRQDDEKPSRPSSIVKLSSDGNIEIIRP